MAGEPATALDLDLAVAHGRRNLAGRADQQPAADRELALEATADLGALDRGGAREEAALGDRYIPAILDVRLDGPLDDQAVAGADLAGEHDLAAHDQSTRCGLRLRHCGLARGLRRDNRRGAVGSHRRRRPRRLGGWF